jgi:hypothetical protein
VILDQPFLLLVNIFIKIPLLKHTILEIRTGARRFILDSAKGNLALHIGEREEVTFIGLNEMLVKSRSRLGTKLIARINVLCWGTLTSHVRGGAV